MLARRSSCGQGFSASTGGEAEIGGFFNLAEGLAVRAFAKEMQADLQKLKVLLEAKV